MALTDPTTLHDFTSGADEDRRPYCGKCDELVASVDEHGWCVDCVDNWDPTPDDRERDADDGQTYADPRDEMDRRLLEDL
jgi:hypothetical protein